MTMSVTHPAEHMDIWVLGRVALLLVMGFALAIRTLQHLILLLVRLGRTSGLARVIWCYWELVLSRSDCQVYQFCNH